MKLIDKMYKQLLEAYPDKIVTQDSFIDGSGSWIEIKDRDIKFKGDKGTSLSKEISFNGKGTKITDIEIYRNHYEEVNSTKITE